MNHPEVFARNICPARYAHSFGKLSSNGPRFAVGMPDEVRDADPRLQIPARVPGRQAVPSRATFVLPDAPPNLKGLSIRKLDGLCQTGGNGYNKKGQEEPHAHSCGRPSQRVRVPPTNGITPAFIPLQRDPLIVNWREEIKSTNISSKQINAMSGFRPSKTIPQGRPDFHRPGSRNPLASSSPFFHNWGRRPRQTSSREPKLSRGLALLADNSHRSPNANKLEELRRKLPWQTDAAVRSRTARTWNASGVHANPAPCQAHPVGHRTVPAFRLCPARPHQLSLCYRRRLRSCHTALSICPPPFQESCSSRQGVPKPSFPVATTDQPALPANI